MLVKLWIDKNIVLIFTVTLKAINYVNLIYFENMTTLHVNTNFD